jgi:hypothetical protein
MQHVYGTHPPISICQGKDEDDNENDDEDEKEVKVVNILSSSKA